MPIVNITDLPTEWQKNSLQEHGRILSGLFRHYCPEWDYMSLDETCYEYNACTCFKSRNNRDDWAVGKPVKTPDGEGIVIGFVEYHVNQITNTEFSTRAGDVMVKIGHTDDVSSYHFRELTI